MSDTAHRARRGYAGGPFGQVHFIDCGEGEPVVLLHQAPMNAHQFDAALPLLAAGGLRAIAIDLPGFGQSDPPPFVPSIADYAVALPEVLGHLGLASAHLVGHHTGALVATEAALAYPDHVRSLVLHGPLPLEEDERAAFLADVEIREKGFAIADDGSHLSTAFAGRAAYCAGSVPLSRVQDYVLWMVGATGPFWYGHDAAFRYDHVPRLPLVTHRTLILTNTGDAIYDHALRAARIRPDWPLVAIDGGGIDMPDQAPAAWSEAVLAFLMPRRSV